MGFRECKWKQLSQMEIWYPFCWGASLFRGLEEVCKISPAVAKNSVIPICCFLLPTSPPTSFGIWTPCKNPRSEADWSKDRLTDVNAQHYKTKMGLTKDRPGPRSWSRQIFTHRPFRPSSPGGLDAWYGCIDGSREKLPGRREHETSYLKWVAKASCFDVCCKMRKLVHGCSRKICLQGCLDDIWWPFARFVIESGGFLIYREGSKVV